MNDPYKVLNVSPAASDDEIKRAYRDLARKYHPDNYQNNPLADLASEKMKEINEAYDQIQKMRSGKGSAGGQGSSANSRYTNTDSTSGNGIFARVRAAINRNDLSEAESLLNTVHDGDRGAEWNFLMGSVCQRKGWLDEARRYYQNACNMDPANAEYRYALNYMNRGGYAYKTDGGQGNVCGMDACQMCQALYCADCCCECMGGDLIRCC